MVVLNQQLYIKGNKSGSAGGGGKLRIKFGLGGFMNTIQLECYE